MTPDERLAAALARVMGPVRARLLNAEIARRERERLTYPDAERTREERTREARDSWQRRQR